MKPPAGMVAQWLRFLGTMAAIIATAGVLVYGFWFSLELLRY